MRNEWLDKIKEVEDEGYCLMESSYKCDYLGNEEAEARLYQFAVGHSVVVSIENGAVYES